MHEIDARFWARFDEVFERAPLEFADEETRGSFIWAAALRNPAP